MVNNVDKDTVLKISLAGLFHDIGKFAQEGLEIPDDYRTNNADLYQPFNTRHGYHTHAHALYTARFIEKYLSLFPPQLSSRDWGVGEVTDSFINLAAKHHKPETPHQWIITQADRLSSGIDRAEFEKGEAIGVREVAKTRLLPLFERLLREDKNFDDLKDFEWRYELKPLSAQSIFPVRLKDLSQEEAKKEYRKLFEAFCEDLKGLCNRSHVELWAQHFDSLYRIYTSNVPAARVGTVVHDVSLYDHSRATASLAGALYLYHMGTGTMEEEAIKDDSATKFLLVSGDFYGIQDFIFKGGGEERHHRAKLLRGRSFLVSLLMELAADYLCRRLGLSFLSVIISAAGKFHMVAPNLEEARKEIERTKEELNHWLYLNFYGECGFGIACTEAKAEDFCGPNFSGHWKRHLEALDEEKYARFNLEKYGGAVAEVTPDSGYLDSFRNDLNSPLCPLCGKRPSVPEVVGDSYIRRGSQDREACSCALCRDQAFIGTRLVRGERLAVFMGREGELKEPLWGKYQLRFVKGCAGELADQCEVVRLFDFNVDENGDCPKGVTFLPINGYVPVYSKEDEYDDRLLAGEKSEAKKEELIDSIKDKLPKTFHHLAQKALSLVEEEDRQSCYGLPALGVLKADVDNLGALFACGLPEKLFTISRLATMSRQLNGFFAIYLPYALRKEKGGHFREIYTVFAGGDDLFLIGPWNTVMDFAPFVRGKFVEFACGNPKVHLSAGITLHKPYTPVDLLAKSGEEALEKAKAAGKDRIVVFDEVATWEEFERLSSIRSQLEEWYERDLLSRGALYRFNELCTLASEEENLLRSGEIPWNKLQCVKWPAFLRYYLVRSVSKEVKEGWEQIYQDMTLNVSKWLSDYRGRFVVALWPLLYETRKQRI